MEFRILGPVEVWLEGRPLDLGPAKQRVLLARLLLPPNRVVSASQLIDVVWGQAAPEAARAILHTYVYRLRQALRPAVDPGARALLRTRPPGYLLVVKQGQLDLDRFESMVAAATRATTGGDHATAAELLHSALALWRGEPLANVASEELRRREATGLEERRLAALEARIEADLHLGRHRDLVGELTTLVADHPLQERLHGQLMLAL
jgi:DNA-binding SARP family transcriptional activator